MPLQHYFPIFNILLDWETYMLANTRFYVCDHKTMCPPGFHHNGFVATHALGHMFGQQLHSAGTNCANVHG